jgi:ribosomal-protein-alanine N-acetyltransferase
MNVEALYAYADEGNKNSRKALEKLGFRYVNSFDYEDELEVWYELKKLNAI